MWIINKAIPFVSSVILFVLFELWAMQPTWTYYIAGVILAVIFLTVWLVTAHSPRRKMFWQFLINPLMFIVGVFIFYIFIDQPLVRHIYLAACIFGYYLVFHNIFSFLHQTKDYQPYALENIYSYLNIATVFFFSAAAGGMLAIIGWPSWALVAPMFLIGVYSFLSLLLAHKVPTKPQWLYIIFLGLITAESFYVLSFLPSSFLFSALMITVIYYLFSYTIRDYLSHSVTRENLLKYIFISIAIVIISLLTTRWY